MCGISGIIMKEKTLVDKAQLKEINDAVQHRGPDAEGFYYHENVGFGHRRLSILELSELGSQPMKYSDYVITYNGEVYNYIEIREELIGKGYQFKSNSDTEVILAAYQEWGFDCVHHFNGMWAFAIHDQRENIVFISRDRFGVKPFHYFTNTEVFLFGSEIRQILTQKLERKVNRQILFDYLLLGYHHHNNETFFKDIFSLDPGHNLIYDLRSNSFTISKWYSLRLLNEVQNLGFNEVQKKFELTLDSAINLRLRSDVKVGTCLSGGLDSSYIASVAAKSYNTTADGRFTAITAKSIEPENDESPLAKVVAENAQLDWKVTCPTKQDFYNVVEDVIEAQEEPFGSPSIIMQYFVMKKAKEEGCIVLLDGQGGDEALLGYDRYYAAYLNQQRGVINKVKGYLKITNNSRLSIKDLFLYRLYFNKAYVRGIRQLRRSKYLKTQFKAYLNMDLLKEISRAGKSISELQKLEITKIQLQKLLKYEDRNSMHFSIETRVPFVDYNVMELAFSMPFEYKIHDGWSKYILRKTAVNKLPDKITWNQFKIGFEAPKNWYTDRNVLLESIRQSEFLDQLIIKEKVSDNIDDTSLWKLYNLAIWAKKFNVSF
jgi:asparagine synthase (glutamine-hydrolysing)